MSSHHYLKQIAIKKSEIIRQSVSGVLHQYNELLTERWITEEDLHRLLIYVFPTMVPAKIDRLSMHHILRKIYPDSESSFGNGSGFFCVKRHLHETNDVNTEEDTTSPKPASTSPSSSPQSKSSIPNDINREEDTTPPKPASTPPSPKPASTPPSSSPQSKSSIPPPSETATLVAPAPPPPGKRKLGRPPKKKRAKKPRTTAVRVRGKKKTVYFYWQSKNSGDGMGPHPTNQDRVGWNHLVAASKSAVDSVSKKKTPARGKPVWMSSVLSQLDDLLSIMKAASKAAAAVPPSVRTMALLSLPVAEVTPVSDSTRTVPPVVGEVAPTPSEADVGVFWMRSDMRRLFGSGDESAKTWMETSIQKLHRVINTNSGYRLLVSDGDTLQRCTDYDKETIWKKSTYLHKLYRDALSRLPVENNLSWESLCDQTVMTVKAICGFDVGSGGRLQRWHRRFRTDRLLLDMDSRIYPEDGGNPKKKHTSLKQPPTSELIGDST